MTMSPRGDLGMRVRRLLKMEHVMKMSKPRTYLEPLGDEVLYLVICLDPAVVEDISQDSLHTSAQSSQARPLDLQHQQAPVHWTGGPHCINE